MAHENRILVVEGEKTVSQLLLVVLETHGYRVDVVTDGHRALERANSGPDLILLDTSLPDYDGFEVCHLLKTDLHTKHIPIIIISGRHQNGDRIESFHLGADDFLTTPFEPEELFARVQAVLRRSQMNFNHSNEDSPAFYETINEMRRIINEESIVPFFQPIYLLNPLSLFGLEVLSRPQNSVMFSNPEALFKAALRFGFYYELEMIVWRKAVEIAQRNFKDEHLFLNCSPHLIESGNLSDVKRMFGDFTRNNGRVFLELNERSAIHEYDIFLKCLADYRWGGFKIAIDDVGAGYASLDFIVQTKPEVVKIDRKIVTGLGEDTFKRSMVKLIVAFCKENGIICIAEGIETKMDLENLLNLGVTAGQGYYLHRPTGHVDLNAMRSIVV
jgi:EAL domain-containing protein (putative c-di-GMP-specific phosphodiesterase class I)/CheY-like chemotaxis protein